MSVSTASVSVTSTATLLGDSRTLQFTPPSVIYVGGPGVTSATGYALTANVEYFYDLPGGDGLYAATASGTAVVPVLRIDEST